MKTLLLLYCLIATASLFAQDSTSALAVADCKGTGTYFSSAKMGKDNRYVWFDGYFSLKIFDLQTGRFVAIYKAGDDAEKKLTPYRKEKADPPRIYQLDVKTDANMSSVRDYRLLNQQGQAVQSFRCAYNAFLVDYATGNVLLQDKTKVYLLSPQGKKTLLFKTADDYWIPRGGQFTSNGEWFVGHDGDMVNLLTNNYTPRIAARVDKVYLNADESGFAAAIRNLGVVRYSFARKAVVDTLLIPQMLKDRPYFVLPIPGEDRFVLYATGTAQQLGDGKAYVVQNGAALPVCDAAWFDERIAFVESAQAFEAMFKKAQNELDSRQQAYQARTATITTGSKPTAPEVCGYCNGTGSIRYEKLVGGLNGTAKDYYTTSPNGTRRYITTNYGYETMKCSACKGTGKL